MPYSDKQAQREYQRRWMAARRAAYFKGKACSQCGSSSNLELDHIDPSKKVSHRIWSWSQAKRDAELAKCQILCSECHRLKGIIQGDRIQSQFSESEILSLRERFRSGEFGSKSEMARRLGIPRTTLRDILNGIHFGHIS